MEVIRLEPGHNEPEGADLVKLERMPSGGFRFTGTVAFQMIEGTVGDRTQNSAAFKAGEELPTADEAMMAGIAWAHARGCEKLYIAHDEPFTDAPERISGASDGTTA